MDRGAIGRPAVRSLVALNPPDRRTNRSEVADLSWVFSRRRVSLPPQLAHQAWSGSKPPAKRALALFGEPVAVSSGSWTESPSTGTDIVCVVTSFAKLSLSLVAALWGSPRRAGSVEAPGAAPGAWGRAS